MSRLDAMGRVLLMLMLMLVLVLVLGLGLGLGLTLIRQQPFELIQVFLLIVLLCRIPRNT